MGGHARVRFNTFYIPISGKRYFWATGWTDVTANGFIKRECHDTVGNYPNANPLDSTSSFTTVGTMQGQDIRYEGNNPVLYHAAARCPVVFTPSPPPLDPAHVTPSSQEQSDMAIRTMASTNPSRAVISLPSFVGELKDLPGTVRDWGHNLLQTRNTRRIFSLDWARSLLNRGLPESYITYRWVIAPMVSDLTKMLRFYDEVEKRFVLLKRLQTKRMIRGRGSGSESSNVVISPTTLSSWPGLFVSANRIIVTTRKVWGSCVWRVSSTGPNMSNLPSSDTELRKLAERLVVGMTTYEAVLAGWELFPFSWLTDWFVELGSTLQAANNTVHATPGDFCTMCTRTARATYEVTSKPSYLHVEPGQEYQLNKWRLPSGGPTTPFVSPSFMSLLSERHFSILASLAALRAPRYY